MLRLLNRLPLIAALLLSACALNGCCCFHRGRPVTPRGFHALFNGHDLEGWRGLPGDLPVVAKMTPTERADAQTAADQRMREHWKVIDGVLTFDGQGDNLCTSRDYADFELLIDWRIPKGGDSGVYIRGNPQVQIWESPPNVGSGGLYNNKQHRSSPLAVADRPAGEWNSFRILIVGDRVSVHLNDVLVTNDTPMENYWERGQPFPVSGSIELQAHGGPLEFRSIFIREMR